MTTTELPERGPINANAPASPAVEAAGQSPHNARPAATWKRLLSLDNRFLAPAFITCILLVGQLKYGILESWSRTLLAIVTSILCELILGRWMLGKYPHLASSYISGISIGILLRSPFFWPYALCAVLSIASKYVLRWGNKHLWNPSNFGVSALLFLYPTAVVSLSIHWGNFLAPMVVVWILGAMIIKRLKRFHICLTYVISFVVLSAARSAVTGTPFLASVAPLTGPMYQLFVFFMITDPRTTVSSKRGQCVVAFLVAAVEMVLRLNEQVHAPYYALFLVGPVANVVEILWQRRTAPRPLHIDAPGPALGTTVAVGDPATCAATPAALGAGGAVYAACQIEDTGVQEGASLAGNDSSEAS